MLYSYVLICPLFSVSLLIHLYNSNHSTETAATPKVIPISDSPKDVSIKKEVAGGKYKKTKSDPKTNTLIPISSGLYFLKLSMML